MDDWEFKLVAGPYGSPTDGPAWDGAGLWFTRLVQETSSADNCILRFNPESGAITVERKFTHRTAVLAFDAKGALYGSQSICRRLVRFNPDGSCTPLAYRIEGKFHHQPRDLVADRAGRIWFTDSAGGPPVPGGLRDHELEPYTIGHTSVLLMESADRHAHLRRMTHDTTAPTAIAISLDGGTLYVSENNEDPSLRRELRAYPILSDRALGRPAALHSFGSDYNGAQPGISGICVDAEGNIVACGGSSRNGPGALVYVFSPGGRVLETHPVPAEEPTNCCFGGPGMRSLFVTTTEGHLFQVTDTGRTGWSLYPGSN